MVNHSRKSNRATKKIQAKLRAYVSEFFRFRNLYKDKSSTEIVAYRKELNYKWQAYSRKWKFNVGLMRRSDNVRPDSLAFEANIKIMLPKMVAMEKKYAKVNFNLE